MNFQWHSLPHSTRSPVERAICRHYPHMESREMAATLSGLVGLGLRYETLSDGLQYELRETARLDGIRLPRDTASIIES